MGSPMLKEKQQPANGIPHKLAYGIYAAPTALTGIKSVGRGARTPPQVRAATRQRAATHVGGGVPDAPETSRHRPSPGKTPGRACPAPTARRCGKPYAVRKRPRRGQDPSLRTDPSTNARTPPQVRAATRQRAATHVGGGVPDAPETSRHRPSPGKTPGRACPAPTARRCGKPYAVRKRPRRGQDPSLRTDPSTSAGPYRTAGRERRQKNRGDPFSRDCLGSLYKAI